MTLVFGSVELHEEARELRCRGRLLPADARTFDLLRYLICHRERIVPRLELLDQFWPDVYANDSVLTSAISRIRKLLRDGGDSRESVRSLPGRGYQFVATLDVEPVADHPRPRSIQTGRLRGRAAELNQLANAIEALQRGIGRFVLIAGEAGIGKTRLAEASIRYARGLGIEVLTATCSSNAPHFSPWRQWIEAYSANRTIDPAHPPITPNGDQLTAIFPSLSAFVPAPEPSAGSAMDPSDVTRTGLFDSLRAFLEHSCAIAPLVLSVDDLHLADPSSWALLQFVARSLAGSRLLIVATYRDDSPANDQAFASDLTALRARATVLALGGLENDQAAGLVDDLAGSVVPAPMRDAILARAEGNPLLIGECWRYLIDAKRIHLDGRTWVAVGNDEPMGLTATVKSMIDKRLQQLSRSCRDALEVASVVGLELHLERIERLCGEGAIDAIEEALRARVLSATRIEGRYRFAHALLRDRIYWQLTEPMRTHLHRCVALLIEEIHADRCEAHLTELAHHFGACVAAETAEKAAAYAQRAGERAYADSAYEDAVQQLQQASEILALHRPELIGRRSQILIRLGDAHLELDDRARASAAYRQANELVRSTDRNAALTRGTIVMTRHQRLLAEMSHVLNRPVDAPLSGDDSESHRRRAPLAAEALDRARRSQSPDRLIAALDNRRRRIWAPEHRAERLPLTTEWLNVALQIGDIDMVQDARLHRITDALEAADLTAADIEIAAYVETAALDRDGPFGWPAAYLQAMRAQLDGRLEEAERHAEGAFAIGLHSQPDIAQGVYAGQVMMIRAAQGREAETSALVELTAARWPALLSAQLALINVLYSGGQIDEARRRFELLAANDFAALHLNDMPPTEWADLIVSLVRATIDLGNPRQARILSELLEPHDDACLVLGMAFAFLGAYAGYLSGLAVAAREWKHAAEHFAHGLEIHTRMRAWPAVAFGSYDYGKSLLQRGPRHRRAGLNLLERADKLACGMNLSGLVTRIAAARATS